ncbi:MAG: hypothetical protein HY303_00185 [Candidatus Wallbacteria bacterium]|nr:hypothetical protein [Candidatus Wallbacteria bacterium]
MKTSMTKVLTAVVALAAIGGLSMTPQGRSLSRTLLSGLGADAAGSGHYQVSVLLSTTDGRNFEFTSPLDDSSFRQLRNSPDEAKEKFIFQAKKQMADRLGYSEARYGADNWKMLSSPKVQSFKVVDASTGQQQEMFRDERRKGAFKDLYAE